MMGSLYLLLPLSVLFAAGIGLAFWWAIFSGQFDDIQSAGNAVLDDDDSPQSDRRVPALKSEDDGPDSSVKDV